MKQTLGIILSSILVLLAFSSCSKSKSYSQYLDDEKRSVNAYLSNFRVVTSIPEDTIFETGEDAPFYQIDSEKNVYMQVIKAGDRKNNSAEIGQEIYFRFMRASLNAWHTNGNFVWEGNANDITHFNALSFKYGDVTSSTALEFGSGIQMPLDYLGIDCELRLIVKSQFGFTSEISEVVPYLYHIRYYPSKI